MLRSELPHGYLFGRGAGPLAGAPGWSPGFLPLRGPYSREVREPRWPIVVFDLDGTLVNTIPLIIASYEHAMWSILSVAPTPEEARGWIGTTLDATFGERYPDRATELVESYIAWNVEHLPELLEEYPGMDGLLADLGAAGATLAVVTAKRLASAEATLAKAGLARLVPLVVTMDDTAMHKPSPEPLLLALRRLGADAADAVYIGDAVVDVQAAKAAGMAAIAVTWGAGEKAALEAAKPLAVVDSVAELLAVLVP